MLAGAMSVDACWRIFDIVSGPDKTAAECHDSHNSGRAGGSVGEDMEEDAEALLGLAAKPGELVRI